MLLPGKTINPNKKITVTRRLPAPGEVLVQRGQKVAALQVIARTELNRRYHVVDVARSLAQPEVDMVQVLRKAEGDQVTANEVVAESKGSLPFMRRVAVAPVAGRIAAIGPGWLLLESEPTTVELYAFVNGVVTKIIPDRGAIIETIGSMIEATCGLGGETYGPLKRLVQAPFEMLQVASLTEAVRNSVILGGRSVDEETLRAADRMQARGLIVGSIDAALLQLKPPPRVKVVATEGFGDISMSPYTFGVLGRLDGKEVSIRGTTVPPFATAAAGTPDEPPLILTSSTREGSVMPAAVETGYEATVGSRVRVTRGRLLGASGAIDSIPPEALATENGVIAPGAYVKIHGASHYIPWANLELVT